MNELKLHVLCVLLFLKSQGSIIQLIANQWKAASGMESRRIVKLLLENIISVFFYKKKI